MGKGQEAYRPGFAIVRVDLFFDHDVAPRDRITVKKVIASREEAEREVTRLNALQRDKGCVYFWQATRVQRAGSEP